MHDDARPFACLQKAIAHIKPREVCFLAYCRRDGRAEWQAGSDVRSGGHETGDATGSGGGVAVGGRDTGGLRPSRISDYIDAAMVEKFGEARIREALGNYAEQERARAAASRGALLRGRGESPSMLGVPPAPSAAASPSGVAASGGVGRSGSAGVGEKARDLATSSPAVGTGVEPLIRELSGVERGREEKRLLEVFSGEDTGEWFMDSISGNAQCDAPQGAGAALGDSAGLGSGGGGAGVCGGGGGLEGSGGSVGRNVGSRRGGPGGGGQFDGGEVVGSSQSAAGVEGNGKKLVL